MVARRRQKDIVDAALGILDESGLDAVTLRKVARRLDAHLNTVSFQVTTKARLLELMADAIMGTLSLDGLPAGPFDRVAVILHRYRGVLLSYRDGARLVTGTTVIEQNTLKVGNAVIAALLEAGVDHGIAVNTFWGLHYFLLGLVQEEQSEQYSAAPDLTSIITTGDFPALLIVGNDLTAPSFDTRFDFGIAALLRTAAMAPETHPVTRVE